MSVAPSGTVEAVVTFAQDPTHGKVVASLKIVSAGRPASLPHPAIDEDAVLQVLRVLDNKGGE